MPAILKSQNASGLETVWWEYTGGSGLSHRGSPPDCGLKVRGLLVQRAKGEGTHTHKGEQWIESLQGDVREIPRVSKIATEIDPWGMRGSEARLPIQGGNGYEKALPTVWAGWHFILLSP